MIRSLGNRIFQPWQELRAEAQRERGDLRDARAPSGERVGTALHGRVTALMELEARREDLRGQATQLLPPLRQPRRLRAELQGLPWISRLWSSGRLRWQPTSSRLQDPSVEAALAANLITTTPNLIKIDRKTVKDCHSLSICFRCLFECCLKW